MISDHYLAALTLVPARSKKGLRGQRGFELISGRFAMECLFGRQLGWPELLRDLGVETLLDDPIALD